MPHDMLRRYPLFNLLTLRQLDVLVSAAQEQTFATGETIFQEGAAGVWAYLVLDGRVRVLRRSAEGREISLGTLGPGELFGDYALLPPHRNTGTCRAAASTRLLRFSLLTLGVLVAAFPAVGPNLKKWLRLHALVSYLREQTFLGFMSAPSALAFLDHLQPVAFRALRTIQADGLSEDRWYFIQSGQVLLHLRDETAEGTPRELGPGDCFGERALLGCGGLPIAVALTDTCCCCLSRQTFASRSNPTQRTSGQSLNPKLSSIRRKYGWVGQREESDCGVAALGMVARFHGLEVAAERIRDLVPVGNRGATVMELQRAGSALGLHCLAVRVELERFAQVNLPAIAHLRTGHYVVLYEMGVSGVVVGDPATGIVRLSLGSFCADCSGNLLLIQPRVGAEGPAVRGPGSTLA